MEKAIVTEFNQLDWFQKKANEMDDIYLKYLNRLAKFHEHMMEEPEFRRTYEEWLNDLEEAN